MRTWDHNKISHFLNKIESYASPYDFILDCGWDKQDYDTYVVKLNSGLLNDEHERDFSKIYLGVQRILAKIERECVAGKVYPQVMSNLLANWNPSGYGDRKKLATYEENVKKFQKIAKLENNSPLRNLGNSNTSPNSNEMDKR